jgi:hypothetical protein
MAAHAEAEAARRWARYAEDVEPDVDEMPDVVGDGEQDSDAEDAEDPQVHMWGAAPSWDITLVSQAQPVSSCPAEFRHTFVWLWARDKLEQCTE